MKRSLFFSALCGVLAFSAGASYAKSAPSVVEFFSSERCGDDPGVQAMIRDAVVADPDVILINCRITGLNKNDQKDIYSQEFCDDQKIAYFSRLRLYSPRNPQIIVDGRYEASNKDVVPAIKASRSLEKVVGLDLSMNDQRELTFDIPEIPGDLKVGEIILYTFGPSHQDKIIAFDAMGNPVSTDIDGNVIVPEGVDPADMPPVVERHAFPTYFRPVLARRVLKSWSGEVETFSFPLKDIMPFEEEAAKVQGYVVVIQGHKPGEFGGPVLAAGQWKRPDMTPIPLSDLDFPKQLSAPKLPLKDPVLQ